MASHVFLAATLIALASAQTPGTSPEVHPKLTTWECTTAAGCTPRNNAIVLESSMHLIHQKNSTSLGCVQGTTPDPAICPDEETCAQNCIMEGISDYTQYGVTTSGDSMRLDLFGPSGQYISPRVYLLDEDEKNYEMLQLTGKEFTFDVDVSRLPCGMNGALYLSEMKADGGRSELNPGGASYGTGYCDAQCFVTPWVEGVGNIAGDGVCCNEMDIWEANRRSNQIAPHTCSKESLFTCKGDECGPTAAGVCDKNGCGDNPYLHRNDKTFYGPGLKVDTTKPFSVVTQFPAKDGVLQAIVRKYVQNGVVIENTSVNITMDQSFCDAQGGTSQFNALGGLKGMGDALSRGMVLALSVWWDQSGFMKWLDAGNSGPCNATEGDPKVIQQIEKSPTVTFSQIKWGEIGSTFGAANNGTMYKWRA
ncbi:hypothetical protein HBH70_138480 [Parastagonospora nodorum]|nr:hypothetical protein HBI02_241620 [Parastagonospora nodorum]KAH4292094.1 hypothetical protein HBI01_185710 [Parastagonospora nodorum]KAH4323668.1 hypothetical protein HBI00_183440 [Parastagonospora nodorum]KAH4354639.1 hypothetical protein HBH94_244410 [Parastagonospora nodorum]KAH4438706.1 hypothetical protein HBH90_239360 [Parastagonospora nodorum]